MVALTQARSTPRREGTDFGRPVAAGARIFGGALVFLVGGYATSAVSAAAIVDGRASETVDNRDGAAGSLRVEVDRGTFAYASAGGADAITAADIGKDAYAVDDQTVGLTNGGGTRPRAGRIEDVTTEGVWVSIR